MRDQAIQLFIAESKNDRTVGIIQSLLEGVAVPEIAKEYDITKKAIYNIK
ncbi:hypothetical protein J8L86_17585 [Shewanella sp. MMG014]|nr:hypothetical protein [Shewanella sp. MMG014]MBQ4891663.1 hypothetical protein [Shewanella sp. MMG014]